MKNAKAVLFDRDGVLNVDLPESVRSVAALRLIPGVGAALRKFREAGFLVLVITNQACVGRGDLDRAELERIHRRLEELIAADGAAIDGWYICTHTDQAGCDCRKPLPGLLFQAQAHHGFELAETWFVGDAERDVEAALAAGARPALVASGKGPKAHLKMPDIPYFASLGDFFDFVSGEE